MTLMNWQRRVIKNIFPFFWPFFIFVAVLMALFLSEQQKQNAYLKAYESQLTEKLKSSLVKRDPSLGKQLLYERNALKSGPEAYSKAYLKALMLRADNHGISLKGNRLRDAFTPLSIDISGIFGQNERKNTIQELTIVSEKKITPFYPARLLTDEATHSSFGGDDLQYKQASQKFSERFYTHGLYFVEHLFHSEVFNVIVILLAILLFGWWVNIGSGFPKRHENTFLSLLNVDRIRAYNGSFILNIIAFSFTFLITIGAFLFLSAFVSGLGSLNYPIFSWKSGFLPLENILFIDLILTLLNVYLFLSINQLLSVLVKSSLIQIVTTALLVIITALLPLRWWSPFASIHVSTLANYSAFQSGGSLFSSIIIVFTTGTLCFLIGLFLSRKSQY